MYNFISSVEHKNVLWCFLSFCPWSLVYSFIVWIVQHDHPQNIQVSNHIFEWTIPLIARLIRLMLIWTLLSPHCTEYYTEQPSDQTARSLRQKRQFPHREFTSPLRERGTQGGRERRSESKGWKSVVESKRWLLPEVICLFAALSTDVGAPFFPVKTWGSLLGLWYPTRIQYVK